MLTIQLNGDFIIQLHKTQVNQPLRGTEALVFTPLLGGKVTRVEEYGFKELVNCYLLTIDTQLLADLDVDLRLDLLTTGLPDNTLVYTSKVALVTPPDEQF